jgi:glutathione S-transferase
LFDSPVICRYLDRLDDVPLISASGWQQWEVLRWEALADGLTDAAYNLVMEQRSRPEQERSPPTMQRWSAEIIRTLQYIETRLETLGDALTLAHIALGAAVGYLEFRLPQLGGGLPTHYRVVCGVPAAPGDVGNPTRLVRRVVVAVFPCNVPVQYFWEVSV